jgi:uncharacterized membrane protein
VILPRGVIILGIVAIVSIALNLFLAGNLVGLEFRGPPQVLEERFIAMIRELPAQDQPAVKEIFDRRRETIMAKWHAVRAANRAIADAVRSEPFDAEKEKTAFEQSNARLAEFRAVIQDISIEITSKISPEGRKRLHVPASGF